MKVRHWIEAACAGLLLTAGYFFGLRHFGIGYGGGIITLALTVPALTWVYALLRWARHDAKGCWVWFGRRYHPYDLNALLWPGVFGAIAFLAVTVYFKDSGLRPAFFAGWLFPVTGIALFWSFWHDRHTPRP